MNRLLKIILIIFGSIAAIIGGFLFFLHIAFSGIYTGPIYFKEDLIDNYEERKSEIHEVKIFIDSKISEDEYIDIEFENGELGIFHVRKNGVYNSNWNLDIDSKKTDSLLNVIGWTKDDLELLEEKLDEANCISAASGNPTTIGWQRSGMGKYYYKIFDKNLTDSLISRYNDSCTYIFYEKNIVLEYGGGVFGLQCFPAYYREE